MSSGFIDAIRDSHTERVAVYLLAGTDPNFTEDDDLITPLHHAAQFDNVDIVELLILSGGDIFAESRYELLTPIEVACMNDNWHVAALLAHYQQYLYLLFTLMWYLVS